MGQARNWTEAELDRLREEWGMYSVGTLAKRLNRSECAIILMARRLCLGAHLRSSDLISINVLLQELGLSKKGGGYSWNVDKLKNAGLPIHMHKVKNCSFRMVDIEEFWTFAEKNRHMFDFSKLEENVLGAEPAWVKVKRAEDFKKACVVNPKKHPWTEAEEKELLRLLRTYRYTCTEIAERLHRSEGSIVRRMQDLGIKERPLIADKNGKWTEEDLQTVARMIKSGSNYEVMSGVLGKSAKAIRGRVFNMYLSENLNKVSKLIGDGEWGDNRPERKVSQRLQMTVEEKGQTKDALSRLAGLLQYRIRQHFDDQDNWQRHLCQNWDDAKGCTAGCLNCDECDSFQRIRPQYCGRCGATFFERKENRICEPCRMARKKSAARKYMWMTARKER